MTAHPPSHARDRAKLVQDRCAAIARHCSVACTQARLEILAELVRAPRDVTSLANLLELEVSWVSTCLAVMRSADWVQFKQVRRTREYSIGPAVSVRQEADHAVVLVHTGDGGSLGFAVPVLPGEVLGHGQ